MNHLNHKFISKAKTNLWAWIVLFVFCSFALISSESHAHEHIAEDDHVCYVCPLFEDSSSEAILSSFSLQLLFQESNKSDVLIFPIVCFTSICLSNSDPPKKI
jgi:hypothetical protein